MKRSGRSGLSLIELIFTIVIIGIVFTVIPKIVFSLNKSDQFAIRQDALFNGISMMQMISSLPWDENNTNSNDILHVSSSDSLFECDNTTHYRVGGFVSSRNCEHDKNASAIGDFSGSDYFLANNIDSFNNQDINASYYNLHISVKYIDGNITYPSLHQAVVILNADDAASNHTTNLKKIDLNITYNGKRDNIGKQIAQFSYVSANIGQMTFNSRVWK